MKTKKLLGVILVLCMLLTVIPMSVYAVGNTPLSSGGSLYGSYYLSKDITLSEDITVDEGKTLDLYLNDYVLNLNGHRIINNGTLNLYDTFTGSTKALTTRYFYDEDGDGCYNNYAATTSDGAIAVLGGVITGGDSSATGTTHGGAVCNNSTFNMYGGNIVGNRLSSGNNNSAEGGGVYNKGSFVMNNGTISGNLIYGQSGTDADNTGSGVYNHTGAVFTMNGGEISYNKATGEGVNAVENCYGFGGGVYTMGTFTMNGGSVSNNTCDQNGGGIAVICGSLTVTAGTISGNTSIWGAGINNYSTGTVNIESGVITNNTAESGGGAVCNHGTLSITGGTFSNNTAFMGGGIYSANGFTVTGGTFSNNTASSGGGIYAAESFTLGGSADITSNKKKNNKASNVYLENGALITPDNYTGSCGVTKSGITGVISTVTDNSTVSRFTSDNERYGVYPNGDGQLEITVLGITVNAVTGGTVKSDKVSANTNATVKLTAKADSGYRFTGYTVTRNDTGTEIAVTSDSFTMPDSDVTVKGNFEEIPSYDITYVKSNWVSVSGSPSSASEGSTVTLISSTKFSDELEFQKYVVYKTGDPGTTVTVNGDSFVMPAYPVTVNVIYKGDYSNADYLTFTSDAPFTITPRGTFSYLWYSTNRTSWTSVKAGTCISSSATAPYVIYFKGNGNSVITGKSTSSTDYNWILTPTENHTIAASGNIMTLIDYTDPDNATMGEWAFYSMFYECKCLTSAPSLPATTLADFCYRRMFSECTALTEAPALPASTLKKGCYYSMFEGCKSLTSVPSLQATSLADYCYSDMFSQCSGIKLYTDGKGEYFQIPSGATVGTSSLDDMFSFTGGTFKSTPTKGTKYYYSQTAAEDNTDYLKFTSDGGFSIKPKGAFTNLEYSTDMSDWTTVTKSTWIDAAACDGKYYIYFRGTGNTVITASNQDDSWTLEPLGDNKIEASGNIMTLLDYKNPDSAVMGNNAFCYMFYNWTSLTSAPKLPATILSSGCYSSMFSGCTSLTEAPELPATILSSECYSSMFSGCTSLTEAPELPATILSSECYSSMFSGFTSLTEAPELSATTLAEACYKDMFGNCTILTEAPELPATALSSGCYSSIFSGCTSLTEAPELPATTLAKNCYMSMFEGCASLAAAPLLPTGNFNYEQCCYAMFRNCSKLKITTTAPTDGGTYQTWCFDEVYSAEENKENLKITTTAFDNMLQGTACDFEKPTTGTVYYLLTNDGSGNYTYNTADNVALSDNTGKAVVTYDGRQINVTPNTPSHYELRSITASTGTESDITTEKALACGYGEEASVTVISVPLFTVNKEIETDTGITAAESKIQSYVDKYKGDATADTTYKLTVKAQNPEVAKQTAVNDIAGSRAVTFYDATFTKSVNGGAAQEIADTGSSILSFTIPYDMSGKTDLAVYRYHNGAETLTQVFTTANAKDGTYYVEGSGADTKITVFASKFSSYGLGSVALPNVLVSAGYSAFLTLNENIDINFNMSNLGTGFDEDLFTITVDGANWTAYTIKDGVLSGVLKAVKPEDIGTDLHIVITYDDIVIKDFNYSVKAYCEAVFAAYAKDNTTYGKLNTLCEALLNYGKWAEDYYNERNSLAKAASTLNTGHEATFNSDYTFTGLKESNVTLGEYAAKGSEAYLTLGSTIKLNFVLKSCTEDLSTGYDGNGNVDKNNPQNFYVLNDKATPEQIDPKRITITDNGNGNYLVSIDLYASQLATSYTLKLKEVDIGEFCITYGVYNYCSAAQGLLAKDGFTDTVKTLCKAIHNYSVAVQAYMAQ